MERLTGDEYPSDGSVNVASRDRRSNAESGYAIGGNGSDYNETYREVSLRAEMDAEYEDDLQEDISKPLLHVETRQPSCSFCRNSIIEPLVLFLATASAMQTNVGKNVIIEKVCLSMLDPFTSAAFCKNFGQNQTFEAAVEVQVTTIEMYNTIVDTVPAIFVSIFLGAFSDKHGRKLPLIFPVIGFIISTLLFGLFSYFMAEIPAMYAPLLCIPRAFGGGLLALIIVILSYVSDITTTENRTMRVASVEGMILLSQPAGNLLGGWLYNYSYPLVYIVSGALSILALLYIIFIISDTRAPTIRSRRPLTVLKNFFDIGNFKETVITVLKRREFHARRHILLLLLVTIISLVPFFGNTAILYYYARLKFNWDLTTYSYFGAIISFSIAFGLVFMAVVLVGKLKMPDLFLAVIGLLGSMTASLLLGFVVSPLMIYLICIPSAFGGGTSLAVRSQVSKLVPREEQGKVFSVLGTFETVIPLIASVLYTEVYNATVVSFPGTSFLMSAGIVVFPLFIVIYVFIHMRRVTGVGK